MIASSEFFKVSSTLLKMSFVSVIRGGKHKFAFKFGGMVWFSILCLTSISSLQVVFIQQMIAAHQFDLKKFCYASSCFVYQWIAFIKIISIALQSKQLNNLFDLLDEIHPKTIEKQIEYKIEEWSLETKRLMLRYAAMMIFMIANYLIIPVHGYINQFINTGHFQLELPLMLWLPFETDTPYKFYPVYLSNTWLGFGASFYMTSVDLLILAMVHLICAHFDYIRRTFHKMKPRRLQSTTDELFVVKRMVVHHIKVVK